MTVTVSDTNTGPEQQRDLDCRSWASNASECIRVKEAINCNHTGVSEMTMDSVTSCIVSPVTLEAFQSHWSQSKHIGVSQSTLESA